MQILFFFEELQEEVLGSEENGPVDKTKIVAWRVGAMIGEFNADSLLTTATLGLHLAGQNLPRNDMEILERLHKVIAEDRFVAVVHIAGYLVAGRICHESELGRDGFRRLQDFRNDIVRRDFVACRANFGGRTINAHGVFLTLQPGVAV